MYPAPPTTRIDSSAPLDVGTGEGKRGRGGFTGVLAGVLQRNSGRVRLTEFSREQKKEQEDKKANYAHIKRGIEAAS